MTAAYGLNCFTKRHATRVSYRLTVQTLPDGLELLVGRQEGHPAYKKTEWWSAGVVICLERGADLHTARLMPLLQ